MSKSETTACPCGAPPDAICKKPDCLMLPAPEGSLIADIAAIRAAVAEVSGMGWKSLDQFQKEMREDD